MKIPIFLLAVLFHVFLMSCSITKKYCDSETKKDGDKTEISEIIYPNKTRILYIKDRCNNNIRFLIPVNSFSDTATLTIRALDDFPVSKLRKRTIAAFQIISDKQLIGPIDIKLTNSNNELDKKIRIYTIINDNEIEILPNQDIDSTIITAQTYHFSRYIVSQLKKKQFGQYVSKSIKSNTISNNNLLQQNKGYIETDLEKAELNQLYGNDDEAEKILDEVENNINNLLNEKMKEDITDKNCLDKLIDFAAYCQYYMQLEGDNIYTEWLHSKLDDCPMQGSIKMVFHIHSKALCPYTYEAHIGNFTVTKDKAICGYGKFSFNLNMDCVNHQGMNIIIKSELDYNTTIKGEREGYFLATGILWKLMKPGYIKIKMRYAEMPDMMLADLEIEIDTTGGTQADYSSSIGGMFDWGFSLNVQGEEQDYMKYNFPIQKQARILLAENEEAMSYFEITLDNFDLELCDDDNPCTKDFYGANCNCVHESYDYQLEQYDLHDCFREVCIDGVITDVYDPSEIPVDDDLYDCLRPVCHNGEQNLVYVDDNSQVPLDIKGDCSKDICDYGEVTGIPDDTDVPEDNECGDCQKLICIDGNLIYVYDPNDVPVDIPGDGIKCFCDDNLQAIKCVVDPGVH